MKKAFTLFAVVLISVSAMMAHPSRLYLIGSATPNGWDLNQAALMLTVSDGVYEWVGDLKAGELKFLETPTWMPSYGPATDGTAFASGVMTKRVEELSTNDNKYAVTAGRYSIRIDLTGTDPQLTVADGTSLPDKGFASHYPETVYAVGSATDAGWTPANAIAMNETAFNSGIYVAQVALQTGELKFLHQRDWGRAYGASVANAPLSGEGSYDMGLITDDSNDNKFAVSLGAKTNYYITVNAVTMKLGVSVNAPTGIEEIKNNNMTAGVYDIQGRYVATSIEGLSAGLYILRTASESKKIIVY